jgi:protein SCO1/2
MSSISSSTGILACVGPPHLDAKGRPFRKYCRACAMWGRLATWGRLAIGLFLGSFVKRADFQPAPQRSSGRTRKHSFSRTAILACLIFASQLSCARHYRAQGIVLSIDRATQTITISHRAIPGYMEAMAMPFHTEKPQDLSSLTPGLRINFQLKVTSKAATVRNIRIDQTAASDVPVPKAEGKISIGQPVPDFTLTDQDGRALTLSSFQGKPVAVDFIYTRCPLPNVCPMLSANFARLQKRFGGQITLLTITLDPQYDTPQVLTDYAHRWRADASHWHFLTGSLDEIRRVAGRFGVIFWPEEGTLTHTSSTAIIDSTGHLAASVEGSSFTSQQLIDLVQSFTGKN